MDQLTNPHSLELASSFVVSRGQSFSGGNYATLGVGAEGQDNGSGLRDGTREKRRRTRQDQRHETEQKTNETSERAAQIDRHASATTLTQLRSSAVVIYRCVRTAGRYRAAQQNSPFPLEKCRPIE
jgi:hypothetical protein